MADRVDAYPLTWPPAQRRTPAGQRRRASFGRKGVSTIGLLSKQDLTIAQALDRLMRELRLVGASQVVVSTNLRLRQDGLPRSDQREPEDPGVAVYFLLDTRPHCLACDAWTRVADNLAATAKHIEALRGQERWGVGSRAQAFAGYTALPATTGRPWWEALGYSKPVSLEVAEGAYKLLARTHHPDTGGSEAAMAELNAAIAEARRELDGRF